MIYKCKECYIDDVTGKVPMKVICKECKKHIERITVPKLPKGKKFIGGKLLFIE